MQESDVGVGVDVDDGVGGGDAGGGGGTAIPRGGAKQDEARLARERATYDTYAGKAMSIRRPTVARGAQICAAAPNQSGAHNPPSVNILCHRVTQNAESSECGPATVDTPGYVDIRTSRAKVDERHGD